jgi:hypothetical protein
VPNRRAARDADLEVTRDRERIDRQAHRALMRDARRQDLREREALAANDLGDGRLVAVEAEAPDVGVRVEEHPARADALERRVDERVVRAKADARHDHGERLAREELRPAMRREQVQAVVVRKARVRRHLEEREHLSDELQAEDAQHRLAVD